MTKRSRFTATISMSIISLIVALPAGSAVKRMKYVHRAEMSCEISDTSAADAAPRMKFAELKSPLERETASKGKIRIFTAAADGMPAVNEGLKNTALKAASVWQGFFTNNNEMRILLRNEPMPTDLMAECYVNYEQISNDECIPTALKWANSSEKRSNDYMEDFDAEIILNSQLQWGYLTTASPTDTKINVFTCILRCIAQTMGFGTTIIYDKAGVGPDPQYKFTNLFGDNVIGPYEKLIFERSGICLKNLDVNTKAYTDFVEPQNEEDRFVLYSDEEYRLYTPANFNEVKSLAYFTNPNSLMYYNFLPGDKFFSIDAQTLHILDEIGWNTIYNEDYNTGFELITVGKKSGSRNNIGIASAFDNVYIAVKNLTSKKLTSPKLRIFTFDKDGKKEALPINGVVELSAPNGTFSIPDPQNHLIDDQGFLKADAYFDCSLDNQPIPTDVFHLALDMRPVLKKISNKGIVAGSLNTIRHTCSAQCDLTGMGFTMAKVSIIEEGMSNPIYMYINVTKKDDMTSSLVIPDLSTSVRSKLTICGYNQHGLSFSYGWNFNYNDPEGKNDPIVLRPRPITYHCIYDINPGIIFQGDTDEYNEKLKSLPPGYYFIKHVYEDGTVESETIKITH